MVKKLYNPMTGQPGRGINYVLTVNASSALLNIPGETSIPVARNHSDIAKIISPTDLPYLHLKTELLKFLDLENTAISTGELWILYNNLNYLLT